MYFSKTYFSKAYYREVLMFIGREYELKTLEETYQKPGFQMTVIYGRRRIGKSTLIQKFLQGKRASYYSASQSSLESNIKSWSEQLILDLMPAMEGMSFTDSDAFFKFAGQLGTGERTILALDEIPYIAEADPSFLSKFQNAIDQIFSQTNIYLILSGSAVSFMEKKILSEKSPLFGRRSNQIFLKPFDYLDSGKFVPGYSPEEKAIVYGLTGGVAKYLTLFDDSKSLDENIVDNYFQTSGYLYEEPFNLLIQEFRNITSYNTVIEVCSQGANKVNEIADKSHISTASLTYILKNLITVGVISKVAPMTDNGNKKKIRYEITDSMYLFWYKFLPSARASIEMHRGDLYYEKNVKPRLHEYMGYIFEGMCQDYTLRLGLEGKLPTFISEVGSWWGTGHDRIPTDIDVVGIDTLGKHAVLGECKFKNDPLDKDVYDRLKDRIGLIDRKYREEALLFFSLSGFSRWMKDEAAKSDGRIRLVTLEEMYDPVCIPNLN